MKRNKSGVRFADTTSVLTSRTPSKANIPTLNHKYLPHLHRETTFNQPESKLSEAIADSQTLLSNNTHFQDLSEKEAVIEDELGVFIQYLYTHSKRNKYNLDIRKYVVLKNITNWTQMDESSVNVLIFFRAGPLKCISIPPCGVRFGFPKSSTDPMEHYESLKSDEGNFLSPFKCYGALHQVLSFALAKCDDISSDTFLFHNCPNEMEISINLSSGVRYNLIPAIQTADDDPYYVAKPYINDDSPASDSIWRKCFAVKEDHILNMVFCTDKGIRREAMMLLTAICKADRRLRPLHPYHIKNTLMLEIDFEIDNFPRWQRLGLDTFLVALAKRLYSVVKDNNMPHFFMNDVNLLSKLTRREVDTLKSALERISENEDVLCRLLRNLRHYRCDDQSNL